MAVKIQINMILKWTFNLAQFQTILQWLCRFHLKNPDQINLDQDQIDVDHIQIWLYSGPDHFFFFILDYNHTDLKLDQNYLKVD